MNRQTKLQDLGVKFIRFSDVDVKKNMNGVLSALKNKVDEIVRTSPRPPSKGESKDGDL